MKISRNFFIQTNAVPMKLFQSGLNASILKSFCSRHKLETKIEEMAGQRLSLAGSYEKFPYEFFKQASHNPQEGDSSIDRNNALRWTKTCDVMRNHKNESRINSKSDKIPKYFILDLETTTKSVNHRTANCFVKENFIVMPGWLDYKGFIMIPSRYASAEDFQFVQPENSAENSDRRQTPKILHRVLPPLDDYDLIVGHNLKFDLTYLWGDPELTKFLRRGGRIWDTMYVEYFIEGHQATIPRLLDEKNQPVEDLVRKGRKSGVLTLDAIAPKYGGSRKIDLVKKAWEANLETSDIPFEILAEYLAFDLQNTELVFKGQLDRVTENRLGTFVESRMDFILVACEIESNGILVEAEEKKGQASLEAETPKTLQSCVGSDNLIRPDMALILTLSSEELVAFQKFRKYESIVSLFCGTVKDASLPAEHLTAVSRFTRPEPNPAQGTMLSFTWPSLREKCLLLLLAIFDGAQEFSSPSSEAGAQRLQERFDAFRKMCTFYVTKNEEICLQKNFTRLRMSEKGKDVRHFLRRVMFCLPTMSYMAFEENPFFKGRRYSTKHLSAFDLKSIENDVLRYFMSSVAHMCHGKIYRHFNSCPSGVEGQSAMAEWTRPDLCINLEKLENRGMPNRYDDNARLVLCTTDGLWIDVLSTDSGSGTKSRVIDEVTNIMQEAFRRFCALFDDFSPIFGNSACLKEFIADLLPVQVKTLL